jgi:hypothetical protein
MRRSDALTPLSRDHHLALFVAQRLRRAGDADAADARAAFLDFWEAHGRAHFATEEDELLVVLEPEAGAEHPLVARTLEEHMRIRRAAARLRAEPAVPAGDLQALGDLLHDHVRFEERELFAAIETLLDEAGLAALAERVEHR